MDECHFTVPGHRYELTAVSSFQRTSETRAWELRAPPSVFAAGMPSTVRMDLMFTTIRGAEMGSVKPLHVVPRAEIGTASSSGTRQQLNSPAMGEVVPPTGQRNIIGLGVLGL